ncbi:HAD family hydrolase [Sphingomonas sp. 37zxx]|uniref:HAD family hydrolase n=1 Tax=Sphingomonas sp. 37zxx TaxID=1550073 RepID=UPI00053BFFE2|nr:HAD family hydrolase [Sphingomonas sp. 37zxx]
MHETILASALPRALDGYDRVSILSLDCFDTLLWRDTHAPSDVFRTLQGTTQQQRIWAEQRARSRAMVQRHGKEVSIEDIYVQLLPNAEPAERAAMIADELAAEAFHCFAFLPTVELMRDARRRGLKIVIISDTYLNAVQLGDLIARAAGDEVRSLIDEIFCSSEFGVSKSDGLIVRVIKKLGVRPETILHVGDNPKADLAAGKAAGVHALHLKQFSSATEQRLRLEAATSAMVDVGGLPRNGHIQPHRAPIAIGEPAIDDPAELLGFTTIGPVLHGFAHWIAHEAAALRAKRAGQVHILFLMRDGHLPRLVFDAVGNDLATHAAEISRFTATAASFATQEDVVHYLETETTTPAHVILNQLLFEPQEQTVILRSLPADQNHVALCKAIRSGSRMKQVLARSSQFAERLKAYLNAIVAPAVGDTLLMVDLGYNGSVQNQVEPVLRRMLGVDVAGRYLLLREQEISGLDKAGFIDANGYDADTLDALCGNVAVLEQLCTAAQGSVVDYTADGKPVRAVNAIKGGQSTVRDSVQRGTIAFAGGADRAIIRPEPRTGSIGHQRAAVAALARLMFLPMPQELAVLEQFQHDVNLGVGYTVPLFDPAIGRQGLRQRGLFYMRGEERMYLPAELNGEGLAVKLTLFAQRRFGLALKYADFFDKTITLPVLIADGRNVETATITATPTHDGYYIAPIPIHDCRYAVGLQFGRLYEWLQVESAVFMPVDRFLSEQQRAGAEQVNAVPTLEGMERNGAHLFRCEDEASFMMIPPPPRKDARAMMLAVVFRPITERATARAAAPIDARAALVGEDVE